jgi:Zn-dependent M16 (insulinase) family peptidase
VRDTLIVLVPVDTAYTIATAGSEGFLKMLPIYIDHILHPTITDAGFVTEVRRSSSCLLLFTDCKQVHHINGAGEDAGVVFSEMQARENQSGDLMALQ